MRGTSSGLAWKESGDPSTPPILLVRPLGGSMALWGEFAAVLATELRVLAFDARGSGESRGPARASTATLADDARLILDARGVERAHVFGLSLGGMVATRLALASPGRVASLILASTTARGVAFERAGACRALGFARCLASEPARAEQCLVARVLSPEFSAAHPAEVARILALAARSPSPRATIVTHAIAALRHDARAELVRLRAPTLVLVGDRDHMLGANAGRVLASRIPGAQRVVLPTAGHDLSLERPRQAAACVLAFVRARHDASLCPPATCDDAGDDEPPARLSDPWRARCKPTVDAASAPDQPLSFLPARAYERAGGYPCLARERPYPRGGHDGETGREGLR